jgi:hypothetical protein
MEDDRQERRIAPRDVLSQGMGCITRLPERADWRLFRRVILVDPKALLTGDSTTLYLDAEDAKPWHCYNEVRLSLGADYVPPDIERVEYNPISCSRIVAKLSEQKLLALRGLHQHLRRDHLRQLVLLQWEYVEQS